MWIVNAGLFGSSRRRATVAIAALGLGCLVTLADGATRAETVAVFDNFSFVDTGGTASDESDTVQATLVLLGNTVTTFTGISAADWTAAGAGADLILIPELEVGDLNLMLTPAARTAISDYVRGGGGLIIMGTGSGRDLSLLNAVFGFGLVGSGSTTAVLDPVAAAGTPFEGGPPSLSPLSATRSVTLASLPPDTLALYTSGGLSTVFATDLDSGRVGLLGWDWFNARPLGSADGGWVQVLGSMVEHVVGGPAPSVEIDASDEFPFNLFGFADSAIANPLAFDLEALALAGRTDAFELELDLTSGEFAALPSFGSPGSGAGVEIGPALGGGTADEWTVARIEGGIGDASLRYSVTRPATAPAVGSGILFAVQSEALFVDGLDQSLGGIGAVLGVDARFAEPGGDPLLQRVAVQLVETIDGVAAEGADETLSPTQEGTTFSYRAGLSVGARGACTGFPSPVGFPPSLNCDADDRFQLDTTNDTVTVEVGGPDLGAVLAAPGFRVALNAGPDCDAATEIDSVSGPVASGQSSVSLSFAPLAPDQSDFGLCVFTNAIFQGLRSLDLAVSVDFSSILLTESPPVDFFLTLAPRCFGDLNGDGRVNNADVLPFLACFPCTGPGCNPACDSNFDGNVNNLDVLALRQAFGNVCPGF